MKPKFDLLQWSFLHCTLSTPPRLHRPWWDNHVFFCLVLCLFFFFSSVYLKARESLKDVIRVEVAINLSTWEEGESNYLNMDWWAKTAIPQNNAAEDNSEKISNVWPVLTCFFWASKRSFNSTLNWSDVQNQFQYHHPDKTERNIYSYVDIT